VTVVKPLKDEETLPIRTNFTGSSEDVSEVIATGFAEIGIENTKVIDVFERGTVFFAKGS